MEIIYKTLNKKSNFAYCSELFKNKKTLNGFNKLEEDLICEMVSDNNFHCQNIYFDKEIEADLFISYPLSVVVKEEIKFKSLHELISEIRKVYKKIYSEETILKSENSNNLYGIWGHSIYDLVIESIRILEGSEKPLINVNIGS